MKTNQPQKPQNRSQKQLTAGSASGPIPAPKPTRSRDARGRWTTLPSASAEALPPELENTPLAPDPLPAHFNVPLYREGSHPPEVPAPEPLSEPGTNGTAATAPPASANPPGVPTATPKRKRARRASPAAPAPAAPPEPSTNGPASAPPASAKPPEVSTAAPRGKRPPAPRRAPAATFTIAGVRYQPQVDDNPWGDDAGDVRQTASGQWYLLAGGSLNDEPTPEDIYPLTPAGIVERLVRSSFDFRFWRDFAPFLPTLYPAAAAPAPERPRPPGRSADPLELPADPARLLPPEHRSAFRALLPRLIEGDAPTFLGFLASETLGLVAANPVLARELLARFDARVRAGRFSADPATDTAAPSVNVASPATVAPWCFDLVLTEPMNSLFRAMLTDDEQTLEEWVREEAFSAVKAWLSIPDLGERLESRLA